MRSGHHQRRRHIYLLDANGHCRDVDDALIDALAVDQPPPNVPVLVHHRGDGGVRVEPVGVVAAQVLRTERTRPIIDADRAMPTGMAGSGGHGY